MDRGPSFSRSHLYFSVSGLTAVFLGPAVDRVDPRQFIGIGLIGMGTCLALVGQIRHLWQLFAVYILMAISFALAAHVPINTVLLLQISGAFWLDMLLVLVFGFTMGNIFMMHSLLTSEIFGMTSFGTVFGFSSAIAQTGSGAGSLLIGVIRSETQSYSAAFVASGLLTVAAAVILSTVRAPQQDGAPQQGG